MEDTPRGRSDSSATKITFWNFFGHSLPRKEIVFFTQIILVYIVTIACIINISLYNDKTSQVWITLLSGCLGYILPNPTLEIKSGQPNTQ